MAKKYYHRIYKEAILEDKGGGDWFLFMIWERRYKDAYAPKKRNYEEFVRVITGSKNSAKKQARKIAKQYGLNRDIILR